MPLAETGSWEHTLGIVILRSGNRIVPGIMGFKKVNSSRKALGWAVGVPIG